MKKIRFLEDHINVLQHQLLCKNNEENKKTDINKTNFIKDLSGKDKMVNIIKVENLKLNDHIKLVEKKYEHLKLKK